MAWLDKQWNRPDRSDHYVMRLIAEVASLFAKKGSKTTIDKFRIEFKKPEKVDPEEQKKREAAAAKSRWFGFLGIRK